MTALPSLGCVFSGAEGRQEKVKGKLALVGRSYGELHQLLSFATSFTEMAFPAFEFCSRWCFLKFGPWSLVITRAFLPQVTDGEKGMNGAYRKVQIWQAPKRLTGTWSSGEFNNVFSVSTG